MKRFDLKGVKEAFANLRASDKTSSKTESEGQGTLQTHDFFCGKLMRHGFPYHPTCMAWDPIQKLLAIGTKHGVVRLLGRPGVDITIQHDADVIVLQIVFLINEGALITVCSDDSLHLWSYRQKTPEIVHSLKFSRERVTSLHLPFQSKWLYLGTERGNVHIVNIETFTVCGYTIHWNKAIELARKTHPGPVVHLSDNPVDPNKLLIGFESGLIVCWDLRCKMAEYRFHCAESLRDACWHTEGKFFMCSHADGTLTTWNFRQPQKPTSTMAPHAKTCKNGKTSPCKPINKVQWKSAKTGDAYVIFSGGMALDSPSKSPCLTIMQGKSITVLEMEHQIIDFMVLCNTVWSYETNDPYAIIVLLSSDLIFIDMTSPGYPCFQCPYALDIHESPVTCVKYLSDCASDLIPAFYSCGTKQSKKKGFSDKEFPVSGGQWGTSACSYFEMLITGHSDGSVKFWDISGINLQFLYRIKLNKLVEKTKPAPVEADLLDDVFAILHIYLDEESRLLAVASSSFVILLNFSKKETSKEYSVVEVTAHSDGVDDTEQSTSDEFANSPTSPKPDQNREPKGAIKARKGTKKYPVGYQPDLVTIIQWYEGTAPPVITCLCVNSSYGLMAVASTGGLFVVDIIQKKCILNVLPFDLLNGTLTSRLLVIQPNSPAMPNSPKLKTRSHTTSTEDQPSKPEDMLPASSHDQIANGCSSPGYTLSSKQRFRWRNPVSEKNDGFVRSRSSSLSSLDIAGNEITQFVVFADGYMRKNETDTAPGLWIGTNTGSVIALSINLPGSERSTQPVVISLSGSIFQMKGSVLELCFLDYQGLLVPVESEVWSEGKDSVDKKDKRLVHRMSRNSMSASEGSEKSADKHVAVICTDAEIKSIELPSQAILYKERFSDLYLIKVEAILMKDTVCLACLGSGGQLMVYSLPSLRQLLNVNYISQLDVRVAKTLDFGNHGHLVYMCTATEIQKLTVSADMCRAQADMQCEPFVAKENPEPPKQSFLKNLFGAGPSVLDRQELFGTSGKASHGIATFVPGAALQAAQANTSSVMGEVARTRQALDERGEKLGELDMRTEQMKERAREFSSNAALLASKYKDSKWYKL